MSHYQSPNILNTRIHESMLWDISKYLVHIYWMNLGLELRIPEMRLHEIAIREARNEHDLRQSVFKMLNVWYEINGTCIVQHLLTALRGLQWNANAIKLEKHMKRYYWRNLPTSNGSNESSAWSSLNQRILQSIISKIPIQFNQNCILICKSWYENECEYYTNWNRKNWSICSFHNAMENHVNFKEIYVKSTEKWKNNSVLTVIKKEHIGGMIKHVSFSNDGTMLAVCQHNPDSLKIYNSMDFKVLHSRLFINTLSSYFNSDDSRILVNTRHCTHFITNAGGQWGSPQKTSNFNPIIRPWVRDNIFLTCRYDHKTDTIIFWLNEIPQAGGADTGITESVIHRVNGDACKHGIIQTGDQNILLYVIDDKKLGRNYIHKGEQKAITAILQIYLEIAFKEIPLNIFGNSPVEQNYGNIETPDHEVHCKGKARDYTFVSDGTTKELYILTERKDGSCFMIIDLVSFELKASILLVPHDFQYNRVTLASNSKCIIRENGKKKVCVWDLKSGACSTHLNKDHNDYDKCEIQPHNPEVIITAGLKSMELKVWRLNNVIYQ